MKKNLLRFNHFLIVLLLITGLHGCEEVPGEDTLENEKLPTAITLNFHELSMMVGDSISLDYQLVPDTVEVTDLQWSSSDAEVATVSSEGLVRALSLGTTEIKVRSEAEQAQAVLTVTVIPTPLENVYLDADVIAAYIDEPVTLNITYEPEDATDKTLLWETSDASIVSINETGAITAKKTGYAWISASQLNGVSDHALIVPAAAGQLVAANQVNVSTGEQKHFIDIYVAALNSQVTVHEAVLYLGNQGDPASTQLKSVSPALTLDAGKGGKIEIEVNADEAYELTFGRYVRLDAEIAGSDYYVYLSWLNNIEIVGK